MYKLIGTMLDNRYEVLEVIGTGGMAIVYKAKCHRLNRYVAVKVMKEDIAKDEEFRRRFFEESQAVAMLSHPNIVGVYDVSRSSDIEYIVMELIDGITLKDYLSKRGPLSWKETTFFATQIAKALEHAHSRDIVHRDIKPQNIMLLRDGTVKVADFGIAHHTNDQRTYVKGEAIGSVHYVSPEQARGSIIDNRSDIYSLGVVMYEMLTARLPFEGNTPIEVAVQHINSIPLAPSDYVDNIPQALEAITMKAMNPTPSKRYASASELIADLEKFKNDPTITIEVESPSVFVPADDVDATRKIANPGQIADNSEAGGKHTKYHRVEEEEDDREKKRSVKGTFIFAFISVLIFLVGAAFFAIKVIDPFGMNGGETVRAPELEGKVFEEIKDDEEYAEFDIILEEEMYDGKVEAGVIISQNPAPGRSMGDDRKIHITVSLGLKTEEVEDYIGMDGRSVMVILERLGLKVIPQYEFSEEIEEGVVMSTDPAKGAVVTSGDSITVKISKGPEIKMVPVPTIIGMTTAEADSVLKNVSLSLGSVTLVESEKAAGKIVYQSIAANSTVEEGTVIDVQVSKEKEEIPEPDPQPSTDPEPDAGEATIEYVVAIDSHEDEVEIMITVDGKFAFKKVYGEDDNSAIIQLTAPRGTHKVAVFQNGRLTKEEAVSFK